MKAEFSLENIIRQLEAAYASGALSIDQLKSIFLSESPRDMEGFLDQFIDGSITKEDFEPIQQWARFHWTVYHLVVTGSLDAKDKRVREMEYEDGVFDAIQKSINAVEHDFTMRQGSSIGGKEDEENGPTEAKNSERKIQEDSSESESEPPANLKTLQLNSSIALAFQMRDFYRLLPQEQQEQGRFLSFEESLKLPFRKEDFSARKVHIDRIKKREKKKRVEQKEIENAFNELLKKVTFAFNANGTKRKTIFDKLKNLSRIGLNWGARENQHETFWERHGKVCEAFFGSDAEKHFKLLFKGKNPKKKVQAIAQNALQMMLHHRVSTLNLKKEISIDALAITLSALVEVENAQALKNLIQEKKLDLLGFDEGDAQIISDQVLMNPDWIKTFKAACQEKLKEIAAQIAKREQALHDFERAITAIPVDQDNRDIHTALQTIVYAKKGSAFRDLKLSDDEKQAISVDNIKFDLYGQLVAVPETIRRAANKKATACIRYRLGQLTPEELVAYEALLEAISKGKMLPKGDRPFSLALYAASFAFDEGKNAVQSLAAGMQGRLFDLREKSKQTQKHLIKAIQKAPLEKLAVINKLSMLKIPEDKKTPFAESKVGGQTVSTLLSALGFNVFNPHHADRLLWEHADAVLDAAKKQTAQLEAQRVSGYVADIMEAVRKLPEAVSVLNRFIKKQAEKCDEALWLLAQKNYDNLNMDKADFTVALKLEAPTDEDYFNALYSASDDEQNRLRDEARKKLLSRLLLRLESVQAGKDANDLFKYISSEDFNAKPNESGADPKRSAFEKLLNPSLVTYLESLTKQEKQVVRAFVNYLDFQKEKIDCKADKVDRKALLKFIGDFKNAQGAPNQHVERLRQETGLCAMARVILHDAQVLDVIKDWVKMQQHYKAALTVLSKLSSAAGLISAIQTGQLRAFGFVPGNVEELTLDPSQFNMRNLIEVLKKAAADKLQAFHTYEKQVEVTQKIIQKIDKTTPKDIDLVARIASATKLNKRLIAPLGISVDSAVKLEAFPKDKLELIFESAKLKLEDLKKQVLFEKIRKCVFESVPDESDALEARRKGLIQFGASLGKVTTDPPSASTITSILHKLDLHLNNNEIDSLRQVLSDKKSVQTLLDLTLKQVIYYSIHLDTRRVKAQQMVVGAKSMGACVQMQQARSWKDFCDAFNPVYGDKLRLLEAQSDATFQKQIQSSIGRLLKANKNATAQISEQVARIVQAINCLPNSQLDQESEQAEKLDAALDAGLLWLVELKLPSEIKLSESEFKQISDLLKQHFGFERDVDWLQVLTNKQIKAIVEAAREKIKDRIVCRISEKGELSKQDDTGLRALCEWAPNKRLNVAAEHVLGSSLMRGLFNLTPKQSMSVRKAAFARVLEYALVTYASPSKVNSELDQDVDDVLSKMLGSKENIFDDAFFEFVRIKPTDETFSYKERSDEVYQPIPDAVLRQAKKTNDQRARIRFARTFLSPSDWQNTQKQLNSKNLSTQDAAWRHLCQLAGQNDALLTPDIKPQLISMLTHQQKVFFALTQPIKTMSQQEISLLKRLITSEKIKNGAAFWEAHKESIKKLYGDAISEGDITKLTGVHLEALQKAMANEYMACIVRKEQPVIAQGSSLPIEDEEKLSKLILKFARQFRKNPHAAFDFSLRGVFVQGSQDDSSLDQTILQKIGSPVVGVEALYAACMQRTTRELFKKIDKTNNGAVLAYFTKLASEDDLSSIEIIFPDNVGSREAIIFDNTLKSVDEKTQKQAIQKISHRCIERYLKALDFASMQPQPLEETQQFLLDFVASETFGELRACIEESWFDFPAYPQLDDDDEIPPKLNGLAQIALSRLMTMRLEQVQDEETLKTLFTSIQKNPRTQQYAIADRGSHATWNAVLNGMPINLGHDGLKQMKGMLAKKLFLKAFQRVSPLDPQYFNLVKDLMMADAVTEWMPNAPHDLTAYATLLELPQGVLPALEVLNDDDDSPFRSDLAFHAILERVKCARLDDLDTLLQLSNDGIQEDQLASAMCQLQLPLAAYAHCSDQNWPMIQAACAAKAIELKLKALTPQEVEDKAIFIVDLSVLLDGGWNDLVSKSNMKCDLNMEERTFSRGIDYIRQNESARIALKAAAQDVVARLMLHKIARIADNQQNFDQLTRVANALKGIENLNPSAGGAVFADFIENAKKDLPELFNHQNELLGMLLYKENILSVCQAFESRWYAMQAALAKPQDKPKAQQNWRSNLKRRGSTSEIEFWKRYNQTQEAGKQISDDTIHEHVLRKLALSPNSVYKMMQVAAEKTDGIGVLCRLDDPAYRAQHIKISDDHRQVTVDNPHLKGGTFSREISANEQEGVWYRVTGGTMSLEERMTFLVHLLRETLLRLHQAQDAAMLPPGRQAEILAGIPMNLAGIECGVYPKADVMACLRQQLNAAGLGHVTIDGAGMRPRQAAVVPNRPNNERPVERRDQPQDNNDQAPGTVPSGDNALPPRQNETSNRDRYEESTCQVEELTEEEAEQLEKQNNKNISNQKKESTGYEEIDGKLYEVVDDEIPLFGPNNPRT